MWLHTLTMYLNISISLCTNLASHIAPQPCSDQAEPLVPPSLESKSIGHMPDARAHTSSVEMRPVVVILVGVPGAGKSTFSAALQAASPGRWERVNQV